MSRQDFGTALVRELRERGMTVTTAESLTAGLIAAAIADVPGASRVLREAYVTYCDEAKQKLAGVSEETLKQYTAVSAQTAREMAAGVRAKAGAELAISATGLAGPDGGTPQCPVGTVFIGCAVYDRVEVRALHLSGTRDDIRKQTVLHALELAVTCIRQP